MSQSEFEKGDRVEHSQAPGSIFRIQLFPKGSYPALSHKDDRTVDLLHVGGKPVPDELSSDKTKNGFVFVWDVPISKIH